MIFRGSGNERVTEPMVDLPAKNFAMPVPLLRSPFNKAMPIAVPASDPTWISIPVTLSNKEIAEAIIPARIGGAFWQPALSLPRGLFDVVVLPATLKAARRYWKQVLANNFASDLLVIIPQGHPFAALMAEISACGAIVTMAGNPHPVLDVARRVYAVAACDLTILAELAGRPVFLLQDGCMVAPPPGFAAARVTQGTIYRDPYTGAQRTCAETIELLDGWRRIFSRNREIGACTGMSLWKRRRIGQLLHTGQTAPIFARRTQGALRVAAENNGAIAAWSTRLPKGLVKAADLQNIAVHNVEDGFIRSAGLGSNLALPASIIVDRQGIYFDPTRPSDLEELIATTAFSDAIIQRSQRLIASMRAAGISKYAAGGQPPVLNAKPGQRVILVPGQVADDLSVKLGAVGPVRDNAALLAAVRARNPDAFIVYRPHPDVLAGHREGAIADPVAAGLADQLANQGAMAALLECVDEVHTMTSLAGFEALLRYRVVETYGQPFYAGWGLTVDHFPLARRQRRISVEQLVAATLILYPLYVDPKTGLPCGPEMLIARLQQPELWPSSPLMHLCRLQGQLRQAWRNAWPARSAQNA